MPSKSTSFRISQEARQRLAARAEREKMSATALLDRLIIEGVDALDHAGVIFRGPPQDRRAALAAGPDVWEIIARLQDLDGSEEQRVALVADETDLHPRQIRTAIDFAAEYPDDIEARIARNRAAVEASQRTAQQRHALLA